MGTHSTDCRSPASVPMFLLPTLDASASVPKKRFPLQKTPPNHDQARRKSGPNPHLGHPHESAATMHIHTPTTLERQRVQKTKMKEPRPLSLPLRKGGREGPLLNQIRTMLTRQDQQTCSISKPTHAAKQSKSLRLRGRKPPPSTDSDPHSVRRPFP